MRAPFDVRMIGTEEERRNETTINEPAIAFVIVAVVTAEKLCIDRSDHLSLILFASTFDVCV